jgi:class 3 adenylate cyclase/tetratricopeptide (TPR) repeat protein
VTCSACGAPLPADARFCPSCGVPAVNSPVERRLVTAFFCDVVGSTTLAERLDPEVLSDVMREYTLLARDAIEGNGGTVATFHGDGAVGLFGLPSAREDDAARAAKAGLDLLAALPGAREAAAHGVTLEARVGIETGEVLGDLAMAASGALAGDVLNTAARLQAEAPPGTVIAGETAAKLLRDRAELRPMPPLTLKGKAAPVAASIVAAIRDGARRVSSTPFVGRERHLVTLRRALDEAVADGAPVLATVLGDPGIGKSRLLTTFTSGLSDVTIVSASVPAAGEGASLAPVVDLVRRAGGDGTPAEAADRIATLVAGRPDAIALAGSLRALLGVGGQSTTEHTWAFRRLLETLASKRPVVVVLDDLHWASPALFDLTEDAARWTRGPVLFLCGARLDLLDARRTWGGGLQRSIALTVGPLEPTEAAQVAHALLGPDPTSRDRLVTAAEGNPLFLEQLAAEARERGDEWDPSAAPTSIRALLEARLDRCSPDVAHVLGVASVQGTRFRLELVRELLDGIDVTAALRQADRARLATEVEPELGAFAHALVRETAYRRLPKSARADLHAAVADRLPEPEDELRGVHLERSAALRAQLGRPDPELERRAGELLARTGTAAYARMDLVTSSDQLERAARLLPRGSPARSEILPDLAVALMEHGRADDAAALLSGAAEEAEQAGSRRDAIRIRLQQLALHVYVASTPDDVRRGIVEGRALLEELAGLADDVGLAQGWIVMDYLHWLLGELGAAAEAATLSVAHAERADRLREQVQAGGDQATALFLGPIPLAELRGVADRRRMSANPIVAAGGEAGLAVAALLTGDMTTFGAAETRWRRAIEAGGLEWPGADAAMAMVTPALLEAGYPERAEATLREAITMMERLGDVWILNGLSFYLPIAVARQGRADEAAVLADALDERYTWMGAPDEAIRDLALSVARSARGRREDAIGWATEAVAQARATDSNILQALSLEHLAGLLHGSDPPAAIATLEEVARIDAAWGNVVGGERVAATLAAWRHDGQKERP